MNCSKRPRTSHRRGSILLADGHYLMPRYFEITTDNVTLRGASGDRHKVILDGASSRHGELVGITGAKGVTIADLTIRNVKWNGFKINSDRGAEKATIYNCVIHNIWQRGVKAPAMPKEKGARGPRECRIQYCLFYNDRPKQFADDETDTIDTFNGNYIGGIDVKNTIDWTISDNVFLRHPRTHAGGSWMHLHFGKRTRVQNRAKRIHRLRRGNCVGQPLTWLFSLAGYQLRGPKQFRVPMPRDRHLGVFHPGLPD